MNNMFFKLFVQSDTSNPHIMHFVDIASIVLVFIGILGAIGAIVGAFIIANAHIKNQKDVQDIIRKYDNVRDEVSNLISQNKLQAKRLRIGMEVANLRFEEEHNLSEHTKLYNRILSDTDVAKKYSEEQIDKLKNKIKKYQNSLSARSRESQILLNRPGSSEQQFEELHATYGDFDTLRFLENLQSVSLNSEEMKLAISSHTLLAHRLVASRASNI